MFSNLNFKEKRPVYLQIKDHIKDLILTGVLQSGVKLPSTRELGRILQVSRNTVIQAYHDLEDDGFIYNLKGQGAYVAQAEVKYSSELVLDWEELFTNRAMLATELDIEKKELRWERGMISFKSIAPDPDLFEVEELRKAFLQRFAIEGEKLLNYGYARGYRDLINFLTEYMKNKGVITEGKEILITNGFTEGLNLLLSALTSRGDQVVCENPTHNTALKIMRLHGLEIIGVRLQDDGMSLSNLEEVLAHNQVRLGFIIPSYHNPTGLVMPPEKRLELLRIFSDFQTPIIEDGFNEELRYSGSHVAPLLALAGKGNNVVYIGSFSKILFPGIRIGWVMGDSKLISSLESLKRSLNIHTTFLDQAVFYEYLRDGGFERYLKKARKVYKERHEKAVRLAEKYIPCRRIWGEGGLHIFIELDPKINAREVLAACYKRGVIFMPGDIFYTDGGGKNTFRLGISRVKEGEMEEGIKIIGAMARALSP